MDNLVMVVVLLQLEYWLSLIHEFLRWVLDDFLGKV